MLLVRVALLSASSARPATAPSCSLGNTRQAGAIVPPRAVCFSATLRRHFASSGPLVDSKGRDISFELRQAADYFPYGQYNFEAIRNDGCFFVDNTAAVRTLATKRHAILLRPPRFGKSLLLSAMYSYYDLNSKDKFDTLFGGLAAAEGEDERRNKYHVLKLDLSIAVRAESNIAAMEVLLNDRVNDAIAAAAQYYKLAVAIHQSDCTSSLSRFAAAVDTVPNKEHRRLLVLVDEYDRYANQLMFENPETYAKLVRGESGIASSSPVRVLFQALKSLISLVKEYRSFTTGIMPIAFADTSGANHITDVTFKPELADTYGFTEADIVRALNDIGQTDSGAQQHILQLMRTYYNGYRFAGSNQLVYNSTLCLFFLQMYHTTPIFRESVHYWVPGGPLNVPLLDSNVRISPSVVALAKRTRVMPALCDQLLSNDEVVYAARQIEAAPRSSELFSQFDLSDTNVARAASERDRLRRNVLSFMYYHGMVTFAGPTDPDATTLRLRIPNLLVRQNLFEALDACLVGHYGLMRTMLREPSVESVGRCLEASIRSTQTPMRSVFNEAGLQKTLESLFVVVLLSHDVKADVRIFDGDGVKQGQLRPDIVLLPADGKLLVHIELKFIKPHLLVPPGHPRPANINKGLRDQDQIKFAELIRAQSMEDRREWQYHDYNQGWRSVAELERDTRIKTEKDYLGFLRNIYQGRKIYSFTVIVMGDSVVVSQVEPEFK